MDVLEKSKEKSRHTNEMYRQALSDIKALQTKMAQSDMSQDSNRMDEELALINDAYIKKLTEIVKVKDGKVTDINMIENRDKFYIKLSLIASFIGGGISAIAAFWGTRNFLNRGKVVSGLAAGVGAIAGTGITGFIAQSFLSKSGSKFLNGISELEEKTAADMQRVLDKYTQKVNEHTSQAAAPQAEPQSSNMTRYTQPPAASKAEAETAKAATSAAVQNHL